MSKKKEKKKIEKEFEQRFQTQIKICSTNNLFDDLNKKYLSESEDDKLNDS